MVIGGNAALLGVLGWLARSLLGQLFAKDLERFKADLASASTAASARLTHELTLAAQEHQIVASRLHEKRAQVIAEVYALLVEVQWASQDFTSPVSFVGESTKQEKYIAAMNKAADFFRYFDKNRIYLPPSVCGQLDAFLQVMRQHVIGFGVWVRLEESNLTEQSMQLKQDAWAKAAKYFATDAPAARVALEAELRSIIGAAV